MNPPLEESLIKVCNRYMRKEYDYLKRTDADAYFAKLGFLVCAVTSMAPELKDVLSKHSVPSHTSLRR